MIVVLLTAIWMAQAKVWTEWTIFLGVLFLLGLYIWKGRASGCATTGFAALLILIGLFTWDSGIHWVGAKDLEITFVVAEPGTNRRIENAKVEIVVGDAPFCDGTRKPPFDLFTDADGIARSFHKQCMCFGTDGWIKLRRVDTFAMHTPDWVIRISAPGYAATGDFHLDNFRRNLERGGDFAKLKVPVSLAKLE